MELRLYSFVNFYLSSIQQGIQTGHCAVDLVRKYRSENTGLTSPSNNVAQQIAMVADWADNYKTFIVLNGGDNDGVNNASGIIAETDFPYEYFCESVGALDGIKTCVAVVLPETVFNAKQRMVALKGIMPIYEYVGENGKSVVYYPDDPHYKLVELLRGCSLAR